MLAGWLGITTFVPRKRRQPLYSSIGNTRKIKKKIMVQDTETLLALAAVVMALSIFVLTKIKVKQ